MIDVQELLFGRSSEVAKPSDDDPDGFTPLKLGPNLLEQAISEIQNVEIGTTFIDELNSSSDTDSDTEKSTPQSDIPKWQNSFTCMYPHNGTELQDNPNSKTIQVLSEMQQYYDQDVTIPPRLWHTRAMALNLWGTMPSWLREEAQV